MDSGGICVPCQGSPVRVPGCEVLGPLKGQGWRWFGWGYYLGNGISRAALPPRLTPLPLLRPEGSSLDPETRSAHEKCWALPLPHGRQALAFHGGGKVDQSPVAWGGLSTTGLTLTGHFPTTVWPLEALRSLGYNSDCTLTPH